MASIPKSCLQEFVLSPEYLDHIRKSKRGGSVSMLAYVVDGERIEMGFVAERADGSYWWCTTNGNIACRHTAGVKYESREAAYKDLFEHVYSEVVRMTNLNRTAFTQDLPVLTLRKSDSKVIDLTESDQESFKAGMDWMLRTMGFPRRPVWAKYLVQNQDKSFTWHEELPKADINKGIWSSEGKFETVVLKEVGGVHHWYESVKRVK